MILLQRRIIYRVLDIEILNHLVLEWIVLCEHPRLFTDI